MSFLRILDCEIGGETGEGQRVDIEVRGGRIARLRSAHELRDATNSVALQAQVIEANGGALLPALHDHHIHLFALAAARASVDCSPERVRSRAELEHVLAAAARKGSAPVRATGYHEASAGPLDRGALDAIAPDGPVRMQHRTGALWVLNSGALEAAGLAGAAPAGGWPEGAEVDERGRSNGRFFRLDDWLSERLAASPGSAPAPDLSAVSRDLAACGVASVTDATPRNDALAAHSFAAAQGSGALLQRVRLMGSAGPLPELGTPNDALHWGERKIVLDDRSLPALDAIAELVTAAHAEQRCVAIHCVTRSELVLAAGAIEAAGVRAGDRVEHASVAPPDAVEWLARLGIAVVTQPGFIAERGDDYLRDVDAHDQPWLYRCAGFDTAGVALGGGTDAPYGNADPWRAIRAAVDRTTRAGHTVGVSEGVTPERALALFTSAANHPGGPPRPIAEGEMADLMLLDRPWARAREHLDAAHVRTVIAAGRVIESRAE